MSNQDKTWKAINHASKSYKRSCCTPLLNDEEVLLPLSLNKNHISQSQTLLSVKWGAWGIFGGLQLFLFAQNIWEDLQDSVKDWKPISIPIFERSILTKSNLVISIWRFFWDKMIINILFRSPTTLQPRPKFP